MFRAWANAAIEKLNADFMRSSDTHLFRLALPAVPNVHLYLKDESTHLTGSLKHRLARSLFLYALCSNWLKPGTPVIEASSGSTAVSEAYFAQLLGLRFLAVMARNTSLEKIRRITRYGGECVFVDVPGQEQVIAQKLAADLNGHFMDQFTYAERSTDWRGNNNIAESIFAQMSRETYPVPRWIVCGAGTGGTSATLGRYIRYCCHDTELCVVDPPDSVLHTYFHTGNASAARGGSSGIEGIGRPSVPASFLPAVINQMQVVPNASSFAAIHFFEELTGRRCGGSTGTNLIGAFSRVAEMHAKKEAGSVVTLICDSGDLYRDTYYNPDWLKAHYDLSDAGTQIRRFYETGETQAIFAG